MNSRAFALLFVVPLLASCGIIGLRKEVETMEERGGVTIQVSPPPAGDAPTYALAWRMEHDQRKDSAGFQPLRADGLASFNLSMSSLYRVGAFTDENRNGAYDAGEPIAVIKDVRPLSLSDPSVKIKIWKLTLARNHDLPAGTVIELPRENKELGGSTSLALGDVASLDEKRFAPEAGGSGLWRPLDFLADNTLGVYFTEPFDARRIPLLLVYGIGGSPQDWRYFIEHFDRSRHQLWFFHYPSGMRLDRVSGALAANLRLLKQRHGFARCDVVAHSMGGLVSRVAITQALSDEKVNFIPRFISISTPWGGHQAAESGIRHLKKPVPSWLDVRPESDFLLRLYATPLPAGTRHDVIYGSIKGGPFWMKEPNDGVVTVASETEPRIIKKAASIQHYPHEHVEMLNQPETLARAMSLLSKLQGQP